MNKIFDEAIKYHLINKDIYNEHLRIEEQKEQLKNQKEEEIKNNPNQLYLIHNFSDELFNIIKESGYEILSYTQPENMVDIWNSKTLEIYYCSKGNWEFEIHNLTDIDIEEGIFAVKNLKSKDGKEIDFYCDLGCRNTGEMRRDKFNKFLQYNSLQEYVEQQYVKELSLPNKLREVGYKVTEQEYSFNLDSANGYLDLGGKTFIKFYRGWYDELKMVITNDKDWNINSSNNGLYKIGYYFDFWNENFEELIKCIELFKEHVNDKIGYLENGKYYSNYDIENFYESLKENDYKKECWNHYLIRVKQIKDWYSGEYNPDAKIINKYRGLEIYNKTELTFNDAAQWSVGDYINKSIITFEYDRKKDENNCVLTIENYIYHREEDIYVYDEEDDDYSELKLDQSKLVSKTINKGTFTEMIGLLKEYVYKMIEIHEIEL